MDIYRIDEYGQAVVDSKGLFELWFCGSQDSDFVIQHDHDTEIFNEQCLANGKNEFVLTTGGEKNIPHEVRTNTWLIPEIYKSIDVGEVCLSMCTTSEQTKRVELEMRLFKERKMEPVLQTLLYFVTALREHGVLWGVGRGSSVSSYVLFLLGVHRIDSIKYHLNVEDFLR